MYIRAQVTCATTEDGRLIIARAVPPSLATRTMFLLLLIHFFKLVLFFIHICVSRRTSVFCCCFYFARYTQLKLSHTLLKKKHSWNSLFILLKFQWTWRAMTHSLKCVHFFLFFLFKQNILSVPINNLYVYDELLLHYLCAVKYSNTHTKIILKNSRCSLIWRCLLFFFSL